MNHHRHVRVVPRLRAEGLPLAGLLLPGLLVAGLLSLGACGAVEPVPPEAVARLGGEWVLLEDFETYLHRTAGEGTEELPSRVLSKLLDQYLEEELLSRLAVEEGLASPDTPRRRALELLLQAQDLPDPTEAEVRGYYQEHRQEFQRAERVRLRQILVEDEQSLERALEELESGEAFSEVAGRYSGDLMGGFQGELARRDLPPTFVDTIFDLSPGEVSEVVEAEYGYHLFQVTERLPEEVVPLQDAEPAIRRHLREQALDRRLDSLLQEARERYPVEVYPQNLPFEYGGDFAVPP